MQTIQTYLSEVNRIYQRGSVTEHSYRSALCAFIEAVDETLTATNEPQGTPGNKPDISVQQKRSGILNGYFETKSIGKDLEAAIYENQFERYKTALGHIIITDYLRFQFWSNGEKLADITIGEIKDGKIIQRDSGFAAEFVNTLKSFFRHRGETIKNATELAQKMAEKATLLKSAVRSILDTEPAEKYADKKLRQLLDDFTETLLPEVSNEEFANIYAQTVAYGIFAAKWHQKKSSGQFTRESTAKNIPQSNPFLKRLFVDIADKDYDARAAWVIDDLTELLAAADMQAIMKDFGSAAKDDDPVIHFYEDFLAKFAPEERKDRGVFYTPLPVVDYIIRFVDDVLIEDFAIKDGLADNSKVDDKTHKLHILDPATGTGTFIAEIVKHIYQHQKDKGQLGLWKHYVSEGLLRRLHAFEILMAPYSIAHLKLDFLLGSTGFQFEDEQQPNICLTNALNGYDTQPKLTGFLPLVEEAKKAFRVKQKTPVMVVIGNPPYNNYSPYNKGQWIQVQIKEYKKGLGEKKLNLDDDYVKFIRLAQYYIDKNGEGIIAFISNNSFLGGQIHRQMRKSLLESFDKIYVINLHGNGTIAETAPDGGKDENVFKIKSVGTAIYICIKKKQKTAPACQGGEQLAEVFYRDVWGLRCKKFDWLRKHNKNSSGLKKLKPAEPFYFFVPKDFKGQQKYDKGFSLAELFPVFGSGVKTERDKITTAFTKKELMQIIDDFRNLYPYELEYKYDLYDSRDWTIRRAKQDVIEHYSMPKYLKQILYRPFDFRYIYYIGTSKGFIGTPGTKISNQLLRSAEEKNIALIFPRQVKGMPWNHCFITDTLVDCCINFCGAGMPVIAPLYIFTASGEKSANLNTGIVKRIEDNIGKEITPEKLFDYIYAALHCPKYRKDYEEFLKIGFPKIPYPESAKEFEQTAKAGTKLRQLHLFEKVPQSKVTYPVAGDCTVIAVKYANKRVYINKTQYFGNVPQEAWNMFIGGYQPAQKYLKDRKGRELSAEEIERYCNIIAVLEETERIMLSI